MAIFTGTQDSKGAQDNEIYLILSHISLFLDPKNVKFLQNLSFMLKSRGVLYVGPRKRQNKMVGARPKILPGPSILSTALITAQMSGNIALIIYPKFIYFLILTLNFRTLLLRILGKNFGDHL